MAASVGKLTYLLQLESNLGAKAAAELRVFDNATKASQQQVKTLDRATVDAGEAMSRMAEKTASSSMRQQNYLERLGASYDRLRSKMEALNTVKQATANIVEKAPQIGAGLAAGVATINKPVQAFATLEEATTDLKVVMLNSKGQVGGAFNEIMKVAVELGNKLPGATKDFVAAAKALKEQGTPDEVIAKGGLKAAGYLGVLLGMDQYASAEMVAKNREAYNLKDDQLVAAADQTQRTRFAFGIKPQDIQAANSYMAATLNTMGITGLENMKKVQAVQGIAAGVGLEGSSFGTNFAMMLTRLNQVDKRLGKGKDGHAAQALLNEHGISMEFFDKKGQFGGMDNMVEQLQKLKPLSPADRQKVLDRLFGVEAGRPAAILVEKGMQAYKDAQTKMDTQAGLDARVALKVDTYKGKSDGLSGTFENMLASMGEPIGNALKPAIDGLNSAVGSAQGFFEKHKAAGAAATVAAGAGAAAIAYGISGYLLRMLRGGGAGAGGALGGLLGGGLGGMKLPLPVYVVNKQMSLTRDAMTGGGLPSGGGAGGKGGTGTHGTGAAGTPASNGGGKWAGRAGTALKVGGVALGAMALTAGVSQAAEVIKDEALDDAAKHKELGNLTGQGVGQVAGVLGGKAIGMGVGAIGGRLAGMATGAAIGSVVPVVGTLIGGIAGMLLGSYLGDKGGEHLGPVVEGYLQKRKANPAADVAYADPMTGMIMGGDLNAPAVPNPNDPRAGLRALENQLLTQPAYLAATAPDAALNAQTAAITEALKTPQKVELGDGKITIDVRLPEGVTSTQTVTQNLPSIKLNAGATQPWGRS